MKKQWWVWSVAPWKVSLKNRIVPHDYEAPWLEPPLCLVSITTPTINSNTKNRAWIVAWQQPTTTAAATTTTIKHIRLNMRIVMKLAKGSIQDLGFAGESFARIFGVARHIACQLVESLVFHQTLDNPREELHIIVSRTMLMFMRTMDRFAMDTFQSSALWLWKWLESMHRPEIACSSSQE